MAFSKEAQLARGGIIPKRYASKSLPALKEILKGYFSKFIRLRDCNEYGYGKCISCSRIIHWKDGDMGHFIHKKLAVYFNEKNVNFQCRQCNKKEHGKLAQYAVAIERKYGAGTIEVLEALSTQQVKLDAVWYYFKIVEYKDKAKALEKKLLS